MKVFKKIKNVLQPYTTKIFWNRINAIDRKNLTNYNFTILCSNCIGGVLYSRLNCKFMSPTINMWMEDWDLIKFAANLDEYLGKELVYFISKYDYPVAKLGDITLYFNHCKTQEEATEQWYKRVDRINRDNLFIIVSDRCGVTEEKIKFFESINCKGKVMFVANKNWRKDYILYLPYYKNESKIGIYMEDRRRNYLGVTPFDGYFDYTHFFNTGEVICKRNLKNELLMKLGKNRSR